MKRIPVTLLLTTYVHLIVVILKLREVELNLFSLGT